MTRKALRIFLMALALLLVAVFVVLTSNTLARWLVERADEALPALSLNYSDGDFWQGIAVSDLRYEAAGVTVSAARFELRWSLPCLTGATFCVDRLAAENVDVTVTPAPAASEGGDGAGTLPTLPVDILLRDVGVRDLTVTMPGTTVTVSRIQLRGSLADQRLRVANVRIEAPVVRVADGTADSPEGAPEEPSPIVLPALTTPLPVQIDALRVERPAMVVAGQRNELRQLEFAGGLSGSRLTVARLAADHQRGRLEISGRVRLSGNYPLSLQVQANAPALYRGKPLRLRARLSESLADLGVKAEVSGFAELRLDGRVRPLQQALPYTATLRAEAVGWPPISTEQLVAGRNVRLRVDGDLNGYRLSGSGALSGTAIPPVDWELQASGDWQQAWIQTLVLNGLDGRARISGRVGWAGEVQWEADVEAHGLDLASRWPQAPSRVSGRATVSGGVVAQGWRLRVETPGIEAVYRGRRLSARGEISHRPDGQWRISPLTVSSGANRIRATGTYRESLDIVAELNVPEPQRWLADLSGSLRGRVTATGPVTAATIEAHLEAADIAYQDVTVNEASVDGRIAALGRSESELILRAGGVSRDGQQLDNARLQLTGIRADHRLVLHASGEGVALELTLTGAVDEQLNWQGRLADGLLAWEERRWTLDAPASLRFNAETLQARLASHCWSRQQTSLCLTEPARLGPSGEIVVALDDMPLGWLSQWLSEGFRWSGRLSGDVTASWSPDTAPSLNANVISRDGRLSITDGAAGGGNDTGLPLGYERLQVNAELDARRLDATVELTSSAVEVATLRVRLYHADADRPLEGRVEVKGVKLSTLESFFPRIDTLKGEVTVTGDIGGSLRSPAFDGELRLRDGEVQGPELPVHLHGVEVTVRVDGRSATIDGQFSSGGNQAQLSGDAEWAGPGWQVEASLVGERLLVRYLPIAELRVSPDLKLQASEKQVAVSGRIVVPEGQLTLKQLPKGAVAYSSDVVVVRGPGAETAEEQTGSGLTVSANIEVVLGDAVRFSGLGAEGRLVGALGIRQVGATTAEATGEIRIVDASFEAYGQELDIRSGRLIFAGPVAEPMVEIEAVRRVESVVVGLRVKGPASQPEITLFSEPPMPEEQILSYLVTGRAYGEAGPEENAAMAQAAVALGVFTSRGAASDIASALGVQDFQLAAEGEGGTTQVTVSGYIAPNLLVKYGVGVFTPQNTLTLRYNVTRNIYLDAVSGLESAIDAFYSFSF